MEKTATSLIALALASVSNCAFAQSSVTLYGIIDDSIQYVRHTGGKNSLLSLQAGQMSVSRWGLKGTEDLGGGLTALFNLENGFNPNSGALSGGLMFGRRAVVGLGSNTYGTVTAGRQQDTLQDLVLPVQPNNWLEYFTSPGDVDGADGTARVSNAVKWTSVRWNGLQAAVMYGFGGQAGAMGSGQSYNASVNYGTGPLTFAAGYARENNGNGAARATSVVTQAIYSTVVDAKYISAASVTRVRTGATYAFNAVTLGVNYSYAEYSADGASTFTGSERYQNASLFAVWKVTPSTLIEGAYNFMKSHGESSATYHQATLAADYLLSKRTDVYASVSYGHASGSNGKGAAQAVIADSYPAPGSSSQQLIFAGIRHRF